jgi:serine/threonine protein kinase
MTIELRSQLETALGGAYRIERELGGGGMSRVFVATEMALGRSVVVKVLPPDFAGELNADRFRREVLVAAQLQHPHIVPLLSAGDAGGVPYLTMPFVAGESLRARLNREGELPVRDAVKILRDVASALAYAHRHGVVHRDIKPDNVLLQTDPGSTHIGDALGNADSTIAIFERYIAATEPDRSFQDRHYLAGALKRLGELYEARGDRERAASRYARFVELWKDADPELQPTVTEVRRRLRTLNAVEAGPAR